MISKSEKPNFEHYYASNPSLAHPWTEQDANNIIKQWINGKPTILNNISLPVETGKTDLEVVKDFAEHELDAEDNKSNDTKKNRKRFNIYRKCDGRKAVVELDDENGIHCTIE
ncbi:hypothetical protein B9Z55_023770 [Caenorhabditis nigoni]|uniref:Uncharacterized protein n=1 Tax=Caenorhabditis nigoni TaxID=1611254 RepID=A0A2G5SR46_9PELO|nr:hypothetical protein B9Z55_023770 [Caenorhabditis nigoni]